MRIIRIIVLAATAGASAAACGGHAPAQSEEAGVSAPAGAVMEVALAARASYLRASGTADAVQEATLSTRLMGAVTAVNVKEGDVVRAGAPLVRIDARDLAARAAQLEASLAGAEAAHRQAEQHARRMRALFAEEAAPRAQLDAAEADLERAIAGVNAVRASSGELGAMRAYSVIEAPFAGTITARLIDPGSFAAPGSPLLVIQDVSQLRVTVTASPDAARRVRRGDVVPALVEGIPVEAHIEGVVPRTGSLFTVNAIVDNRAGLLAPGSATLDLPLGTRDQIVIPTAAVVRRSDLTGVWLKQGEAAQLRWVRLGPAHADSVEVLSGLKPGDHIVVPAPAR